MSIFYTKFKPMSARAASFLSSRGPISFVLQPNRSYKTSRISVQRTPKITSRSIHFPWTWSTKTIGQHTRVFSTNGGQEVDTRDHEKLLRTHRELVEAHKLLERANEILSTTNETLGRANRRLVKHNARLESLSRFENGSIWMKLRYLTLGTIFTLICLELMFGIGILLLSANRDYTHHLRIERLEELAGLVDREPQMEGRVD